MACWLISSDLHLTDLPRDEYRFGLFPWLAQQQKKYGVTATFLLGDLTDRKDNHSSTLVNRTIDELVGLRPPVFILRGNHDGTSPDNPFFGFLSCIDGIVFVTEPVYESNHRVALIPHCRDQAELDKACGIVTPETQGVFCHQTLAGALAETGATLTGLRWPLAGFRVWAGDVHAGQRLACGVAYVGAPYHIRFNDTFTPRVLLVNGSKEQDLYYPAPRKWTLMVRDADEIANDKRLKRGDQVKVVLELAREEVVGWATERQRVLAACRESGLDIYGVELRVNSGRGRERVRLGRLQAKSAEQVVTEFCQRENIASQIKKAGLGLCST